MKPPAFAICSARAMTSRSCGGCSKSRGVDPKDIIVLSDGLPEGADYPVLNGAADHRAISGRPSTRSPPKPARMTISSSTIRAMAPRQPDDDPAAEIEPEADGYDQVLLPSDTGPYDPAGGGIKNALVDDELGQKLDAIRAEGHLRLGDHRFLPFRHRDARRQRHPLHRSGLARRSREDARPRAAGATRGGTRKGAIVERGTRTTSSASMRSMPSMKRSSVRSPATICRWSATARPSAWASSPMPCIMH